MKDTKIIYVLKVEGLLLANELRLKHNEIQEELLSEIQDLIKKRMDKMICDLKYQMISLIDSEIISDNNFGEDCSEVEVFNDILEMIDSEWLDNSEGLYKTPITEKKSI